MLLTNRQTKGTKNILPCQGGNHKWSTNLKPLVKDSVNLHSQLKEVDQVIIKVSGHLYRCLTGGYYLEIGHFRSGSLTKILQGVPWAFHGTPRAFHRTP